MLDGMNVTIQLKFRNNQNYFEIRSTTVLHGSSFEILQKNDKTKKNLEASYIYLRIRDLNEQKDFERLVLFRNGVTWSN